MLSELQQMRTGSMTSRSKLRSKKVFIRTALSALLILAAGVFFSLPSLGEPVESNAKSPILLAVDPQDEGRLPPPPALKKRGASDEQAAPYQPEPVDDGNAPQFGGDANREMIMRRRAIRQKMMQQFGQGQGKGFANEGQGEEGQIPDSPGRRMRGMQGGFGAGEGEPSGFGRRRGRGFPGGEGGPGFSGEEGAGMPGFAGQGGEGMRRFRGGQGMRRFGGPEGVPGFGGPDGGPGGMRGPGAFGGADGGPGGMRGPAGPEGGFSGEGGYGGFRQRRAGMSGGGFGGGGKSLDLTPLGLNEGQKSKIQAMRQQTKLKLRDIQKGLKEKQFNMRNLMFSPDASEAQIRTARRELRSLQDQMDETNLNDLLAIRSMLTPEQRKKLPECMPGQGQSGLNRGGAPGGPGFAPDGPPTAGPTAFQAKEMSEAKFAVKTSKGSGGMYRKHAANANQSAGGTK